MAPKKRRVLSCDSCRRLRTRCEKLGNASSCTRCERLRLVCTFSTQPPTLESKPSDSCAGESRIPATVVPCLPEDQLPSAELRVIEIENAIAGLRSLLVPTGSESKPVSLRTCPPIANQAATHAPAPASTVYDEHSKLMGSMGSPAGFSRTAPISVVRDMKHNILGTTPGAPKPASIDCITLGLISEEHSKRLVREFRSLRLERFGLDIDPWKTRQDSPLLFSSCLLVGLHTIPTLCQSQLHDSLYTYTQKLLSETLLRTPLCMESVQAMLIFSHWNLAPAKHLTYIDSWLLSGVGILHGRLSLDYAASPDSARKTSDYSESKYIQTWNGICITHIRFSVGTGQCPMVNQDSLRRYTSDKEGDAMPWDRILIAEARLYSMIFQNIMAKLQTVSSELDGDEIENWRLDHSTLIDTDTSGSLLFAYSCAHLVVARHLLKVITGAPPTAFEQIGWSSSEVDSRIEIQTNRALVHSLKILNICRDIFRSYGNATPAYTYMMCTTAAITVMEFPQRIASLGNAKETRDLIEDIQQCITNCGRKDVVFEWATNVMRASS